VMDVVGSAASILALAQTVISVCIEVRATYRSNAGFDTTFNSAILDAEVQVQRLVNWGKSFRPEACSAPLLNLLDRVLRSADVEIRNIQEYVEKYIPGRGNLRSSPSIGEPLDALSMPVQKQIQFGNADKTYIKEKGPSIIKRFHYVISDKDR
jgi:hypothetical protein